MPSALGYIIIIITVFVVGLSAAGLGPCACETKNGKTFRLPSIMQEQEVARINI